MFRPTQVKALPGYRLQVRYEDGVEGEVDLSHLAGKGVFRLWDDGKAFTDVRITEAGAIAWSDEVDLCPDALYLQITGKTPAECFPNLKAAEHSA